MFSGVFLGRWAWKFLVGLGLRGGPEPQPGAAADARDQQPPYRAPVAGAAELGSFGAIESTVERCHFRRICEDEVR
jgi:hypothetical protein